MAKRMFRCCNCGKLFDWPREVQESRGEYWGVPCYETNYLSPCCGTEEFEEIEEGQEDGRED